MSSQLVEYLEHNSQIHPNLHGSRSGYNTSTALLQLYDKWVQEVEEWKMVGVLFCDQSSAFDLCDHSLLIEKLKLMGVDDSALHWIKSYLSNRKQSCFIDGELSTPLNLFDCGVPQGSIGGPLLWLCFTCDQPDVIHDHPINGQDLQRGCGTGEQDEGIIEEQEVGTACPGVHGEDVHEDHEDRAVQGARKDCGELVGYVDDGHTPMLIVTQLSYHWFSQRSTGCLSAG